MQAVLSGSAPACRAEDYETQESLKFVKSAEEVRKEQLVSRRSPLGRAPGCDINAPLTGPPHKL
jgi:hypothetical protein